MFPAKTFVHNSETLYANQIHVNADAAKMCLMRCLEIYPRDYVFHFIAD